MALIVVATNEEYEVAKKRFTDPIVVTGVGAMNVIKALSNVDRDEQLLNFGYAGSNNIGIGTEVVVGEVEYYHPNVSYTEDKYILGDGVKCYTSSDFVLNTDIKEDCVFDMELAFILALGFKNVSSVKIVSDNLNLKQYEESVK